MARRCVGAIVVVVALGGASPPAAAKAVHCSYYNYPTVLCTVPMPSRWHTTITFTSSGASCSGKRRFVAYDRSKRVDLTTRGKWVGRGHLRFYQRPSVLGPLRAHGYWNGQQIRFVNRSRFPIAIEWLMDCPL